MKEYTYYKKKFPFRIKSIQIDGGSENKVGK